jgi:mannan endo-1,4-beta-mannosidase
MKTKKTAFSIILSAIFTVSIFAESQFVRVKEHQFFIGEKPYYFIGTNYWYGGLLGLEKDKKRGAERLRRELDFLKKNGVTNLRVMAGVEGTGLINGVERIAPPLQPVQGKFNTEVLDGLDLLLFEMGKRNMKAVIFFSNNWEWSGGFQQYLIWNKRVPKDMETRRLTWDELRDTVSQFYACVPCKSAYFEQISVVMNRTNKFSRKKYIDDTAIMAWEIANEPRPMRSFANEDYKKFIAKTAAFIKKKDKNHLVAIGHEGRIGTESAEIFEEIHKDQNIDYLTIHIWAKNWNWFRNEKLSEDFPFALEKAQNYINEHIAITKRLNKPLVIEEFGLPRNEQSFDTGSPTTLRDQYFEKFFSILAENAKQNAHLAGVSFWAFGGTARPVKNQTFWKKGDDYMGDPPMEEQGLNTIFDTDKTTWAIINKYAKMLKSY